MLFGPSMYQSDQHDGPNIDLRAGSFKTLVSLHRPNRSLSVNEAKYDAILLLSFGGPEGPDDVIPFLENVLRGRNVPRARLEAVAEHYQHFGGVSPINEQNRAVKAALETELAAHGIDLPVYFGNRNWHPMLEDTLRQMQADGVKRFLTWITSSYSCYSGCRQYRENLAAGPPRPGPRRTRRRRRRRACRLHRAQHPHLDGGGFGV